MPSETTVHDWQAGGFGLYIHWPFCEAKCPYCDFNSFVSRSIDQAEWCQAYLTELDRVAAQTRGRSLNSIYFGGGTPSLMDPKTVEKILQRTASHWNFSNTIEITLEANPSSVETGRFLDFHQAGVNRVSLGLQALNDTDLRALGRLHTVAEGLQALDVAKSVFGRVSFDLICARQHQTLDSWRSELETALGFGTDHLSIYQLTIEPGTAFGNRYKLGKLAGLPDEDLGADMYFATQDICEAHGLPAYEVSNHARPGQESRHNMIYWQYGDYLGIGPGAHGRVTLDGTRYATETQLNPTIWLRSVAEGRGYSKHDMVPTGAQAEEYAMMSLRTALGMDLDRFSQLNGADMNMDKLSELESMGLLRRNNQTLTVTQNGRPVLNAILAELLAD